MLLISVSGSEVGKMLNAYLITISNQNPRPLSERSLLMYVYGAAVCAEASGGITYLVLH